MCKMCIGKASICLICSSSSSKGKQTTKVLQQQQSNQFRTKNDEVIKSPKGNSEAKDSEMKSMDLCCFGFFFPSCTIKVGFSFILQWPNRSSWYTLHTGVNLHFWSKNLVNKQECFFFDFGAVCVHMEMQQDYADPIQMLLLPLYIHNCQQRKDLVQSKVPPTCAC